MYRKSVAASAAEAMTRCTTFRLGRCSKEVHHRHEPNLLVNIEIPSVSLHSGQSERAKLSHPRDVQVDSKPTAAEKRVPQ